MPRLLWKTGADDVIEALDNIRYSVQRGEWLDAREHAEWVFDHASVHVFEATELLRLIDAHETKRTLEWLPEVMRSTAYYEDPTY